MTVAQARPGPVVAEGSSVDDVRAPEGLSSAEAARRLERFGPNALDAPRRPGLFLRFLKQVREPMALLLLAAATVSWLGLEEYADASAIVAIVAANIVIALIQEGKATRALDALRSMEAPMATAVRDGSVVVVPAHHVVPGDLLVLSAGDQIAADATLVDSAMFEVNESMLTGESLPVAKWAGGPRVEHGGLGDQIGLVYAGTFVERGTAHAVVTATGAGTELGAIAKHLDQPEQTTPLQQDLGRTTARLGALALAIAAVVFGITLIRLGTDADGLEIAFLSAAALAVAAVPEGLPTVVTVALALGVRRMATHRAVVRRLPAVETLGSTTVILTDKTGTLTQNRMLADAIVTPDGAVVPLGGTHPNIPDRLARVLVLCNDASIDPPWGDPMELAMLEAVGASDVRRLRDRHLRVAAAPFDPDRRRMTTVNSVGGRLTILVKGAPEAVLERCRGVADADGGERALEAGDTAAILRRAGELAGSGSRVLALADGPSGDRSFSGDPSDDGDLTFLALVTLRDPVRPEAAGAVSEANFAGIRILMVTGDHPGTALAIAREIGLAGPSAVALTGAEIRRDGLPPDPTAVAVYARVDPGEKLAITRSLQAQGHVVAVTGDGVNDAPALRRADIGVAMGRSGSDVAREAADMVVTDDNLATIVEAVREGRGIYDNIRKVVEYLVAGNLSEILVVVAGLLFFPGLGVPLLPLQLLWINLLTDGFPALALGVDPVDPTVMANRPRAAMQRMLGGKTVATLLGRGVVIATASLAGLAISRYAWNEPWSHARATMFSVLVAAHLLYAFVVSPTHAGRRGGRNGWLVAAVAGGLLLQVSVIAIPALQEVFGTAPLTFREWVLVVAGGVAPFLVLRMHRPA